MIKRITLYFICCLIFTVFPSLVCDGTIPYDRINAYLCFLSGIAWYFCYRKIIEISQEPNDDKKEVAEVEKEYFHYKLHNDIINLALERGTSNASRTTMSYDEAYELAKNNNLFLFGNDLIFTFCNEDHAREKFLHKQPMFQPKKY